MPARFRVVAAVHLLLLRDGGVRLARRANTGYEDGKWSVPAGHLDGGESVQQAAVREAAEEIDVAITPDGLEFGHVMHRNTADDERVDFFMVSTRWTGEPRIAEPDKCSSLSWELPADLPADVIPYVRHGICEALAGRPFSEFGWGPLPIHRSKTP